MICQIISSSDFLKVLKDVLNPKEPRERANETVAGNSELDMAQLAAKFPAVPASVDGPPYLPGQRLRIIGGIMSNETARGMTSEFRIFAQQRPNISKPVHHAILSAAPGDSLTAWQWEEIGEQYAHKMGFVECPYTVIQHRDTAHDHIHIVLSRVSVFGKVTLEWQNKMRAEKLMRDFEQQYNLTRVPSSRVALRRAPTRSELIVLDRTGKRSVKMVMQDTIDVTLKRCPPLIDFIEELQEQGISVFPYLQSDGRVSGISFELDGKAMKGCSLGRGYSWNGLQERGLSYEAERDYLVVAKANEARGAVLSRSD